MENTRLTVGAQQSIANTRFAFGDGICQSRRAVWSHAIITSHCCVSSAVPHNTEAFSIQLAWLGM